MAFGFSGGSAENIRPRPPLREDFAVIREEPNLRIAFSGDSEEEYEVERVDADGSATVVGSSSSPDILVPSRAQEHRVVAKNKELGIRGTPSVPKKELKPDHRWQMPLPRNLLDDPESFDPATTDWDTFEATFNGVVSNVGPNGESAAQFTYTSDPGLGAVQDKNIDNKSIVGAVTAGFFVRTVSGSHGIGIEIRDDTNNSLINEGHTITTEWQWISTTATVTSSDNGVGFSILRADGDYSIYLLRAVLNRGSSRLFSTRSEVPQTIPDVVQGADLSNGSTDSPDTNDLDFGVDEDGVPFAVSDGDDQSSKIQSENLGAATWAFRVYLPNSWSGRKLIFGNQNEYARLDANAKPYMGWIVYDPNKEFDAAEARNNNANLNSWNTCVCTIEEGKDRVRFNLNGTVVTESVSDPSAVRNNPVGLNMDVPGFAVSHFERHPVLTEAEAEAVRQRLAGNPPDPVPPTEAWDFTAETSPHNLVKHSEDFSQWSGNATVTTDTDTAPDGTKTADTVEDTNSNRFSGVDRKWGTNGNNEKWTLGLFVEKGANPILELQAQVSKTTQIQLDPDTGDIDKNRAGSSDFVNAGLIDYDENWWFIWLTVKDGGSTSPRVKIFPAVTPTLGSGGQSPTGSNVFWGAQVVRGDVSKPEYVQTGSSIAFPQTVPALRDSSNDLTLGSSSGADTNDGSWIAPIGMAEDGDDQLRALTKRPTVTWVERVKYTATRAFGRSVNGWKVTDTDLVVEDTGGNTASAAHGQTINDGVYHTLAVLIDEVAGAAELYIDGATAPDATVDLSTVGTLKSSDVELLAEGGTIKQPAYYTRALSGEEIAYLHERLVDNPQSAHPEYTTP